MSFADAPALHLRISLGDYPHSLPLKRGEVTSPNIAFDFTELFPAHLAFKPMIRERAFDISEMAIITYLQAREHDKPMVLLPAVMLGRFQHHTMFYNAKRGVVAPADLAGRRVGVRAYTQTTGAWLRGILATEYDVPSAAIQWITYEDAHVPEYSDPPDVIRARDDQTLDGMLESGEIDAAIYGAELPENPDLQSVIPEPETAARVWHAKYGVVPINHMVVVSQALSRTRPELVREFHGMLRKAKARAMAPADGDVDYWPMGVEACRPALEMIIDYAVEQRLISRRFTVDELFDDVTGAL